MTQIYQATSLHLANLVGAIVDELSPAAASITGSCIRIDGGTPNLRNNWKLESTSRTEPFMGFHRAVMPNLLRGS